MLPAPESAPAQAPQNAQSAEACSSPTPTTTTAPATSTQPIPAPAHQADCSASREPLHDPGEVVDAAADPRSSRRPTPRTAPRSPPHLPCACSRPTPSPSQSNPCACSSPRPRPPSSSTPTPARAPHTITRGAAHAYHGPAQTKKRAEDASPNPSRLHRPHPQMRAPAQRWPQPIQPMPRYTGSSQHASHTSAATWTQCTGRTSMPATSTRILRPCPTHPRLDANDHGGCSRGSDQPSGWPRGGATS